MFLECHIQARLNSDRSRFDLNIDFSADTSSIVLFGPSGSGKSLTLMAIAGLFVPDSGRIAIGGKTVFDSSQHINVLTRNRNVGILFQDYELFPHLSVRENVAFGIKKLFRPFSAKQTNQIARLLAIFDLENQADQMPHQLSGGQQQRAALARAMARNPGVLLLDEPFNALDQPLRARMRKELKRIQEAMSIPMVFVTHDPEEVDIFGDTLVSFGGGRVMDVIDYRSIRAAGTSGAEILAQVYNCGSDDNR